MRRISSLPRMPGLAAPIIDPCPLLIAMSLLFSAYPLARSALFSLDAETAHELTLSMLQKTYDCTLTRQLFGSAVKKPRTLMGLNLRNPVGLAAGLDKNGAHIDALGNLGFGFVEVGTVTPKAQPGNPKPRLFRLPRSQALINRLGFNNQGLEVFLNNVKNSHWRAQGGVLGLNIGKNAATPIERAVDDYLIGLEGVYPHADYITVNISSPNTQNLRALQGHEELDRLLSALHDKREQLADGHGKRVPLAVKIAPDLDISQIDLIAELLGRYNVDGVIATNTTLSRDMVQGLPHANEAGGLSGPPAHELSLRVIERLRTRLGSSFAIIGVGGIMSGRQAREKVAAGANAIQLYTGLIYRGPALIAECVANM
jgi:dihydroorotate dehydrogenase